MKILLTLGFLFLCSVSVDAQTVAADRFRFNTGPCVIRSGSGSPEGVVTGNKCDEWRDIDTNVVYEKITSVGNTGWFPLVGPSAATCATFAGCVAHQLTIDTTLFRQVLRTDPEHVFQMSVTNTGTYLDAYHPSGWQPLTLSGGPTRIGGGGLVIGRSGYLDPEVGNALLDGFISKPGYVSQTFGWRIDGLGAADFRYLFTDTLHARKFIADLEQALAGLQIIAKSVGQIGTAFTMPALGAAAPLTMQDLPSADDMAVFESGDTVWLRSFSRAAGSLTIADAYGVVTGYTDLADGLQSWTFTRNSGANGGSMSAGVVIAVDSIVLDLGVSGNGVVETNAVDGIYGINAPYQQVWTWSGASPISGNRTLRTRLGNLRGITGVTGEYGLIAGTYAATGGQYLRASSSAFEVHGLNLSLWDGANKVIELNRTAPSFAMGSTLPSGYASGTGIWMGKDGGVFKSRVGIPGGFGWFWDGTKLTWTAANTTLDASGNLTATSATLSGAITATSGAVGGWSIGATSLTAGSGANTVGLDSGGSNPAIYAGSATPGSAPFRVTSAGALTATNATITGAITATSGSFTGAVTATSGSFTGAITAQSGSIEGALTIGSGGSISSVAAGFSTGTGIWMDYNGGTPRFRAGNPAGNRISWDGAEFLAVTNTINISNTGITLSADTDNAFKFTNGAKIWAPTSNLRIYSGGGNVQIYGGSGIDFNLAVTSTGVSVTNLSADGATTLSGNFVLTNSKDMIVNGQTGQTTSFGVDDVGCAGSGRRSLFFQNGILYASACQ